MVYNVVGIKLGWVRYDDEFVYSLIFSFHHTNFLHSNLHQSVRYKSPILFLYSYPKSHRVKFDKLAQLQTIWTLFEVTYVLAASADILISVVMVILLQRSKTGFQRTTDLVNRLVGRLLY